MQSHSRLYASRRDPARHRARGIRVVTNVVIYARTECNAVLRTNAICDLRSEQRDVIRKFFWGRDGGEESLDIFFFGEDYSVNYIMSYSTFKMHI